MHLYLSLDTSFGYIFVVTLNAVKLTLFIYFCGNFKCCQTYFVYLQNAIHITLLAGF